MLRETSRDSVLLPQEHKRQTEKVFGSAELYEKIHCYVQYTTEDHTWVITVKSTAFQEF